MKIVFEGDFEAIRKEAAEFFNLGSAPAVEKPSRMPETAEPMMDKTGCLWDERIHSSSKSMTQDGKWKKKRGVDEELYKQLTTPSVPAPPQVEETPPAPPAPAPPPPAAPATLTDIITHVAKCRDELKIEGLDEKLNVKAVECGLTQFSDLFNPSTAQEVINTFYAKITGQLK